VTTIPIGPALDYLWTEHRVPASYEHTGGGNWVVGLGACHGYSEEQGTDVYAVNVGPVYREPDGTFTGEAGDLYLVSASPNRDDVVIHIEGQLLPTILSMLGIEDVTVDDPTITLDDIATELGGGWSIGCLGGNNYGVTSRDGTIVTLDAGSVSFLPASVTVGRQADDWDEWREVWSGSVWSAAEVADVVRDRVAEQSEPTPAEEDMAADHPSSCSGCGGSGLIFLTDPTGGGDWATCDTEPTTPNNKELWK
jgi:hypothetical protein